MLKTIGKKTHYGLYAKPPFLYTVLSQTGLNPIYPQAYYNGVLWGTNGYVALLRSYDNGETWETVSFSARPAGFNMYFLHFTSAGTLLIGGAKNLSGVPGESGGAVFRCTNPGDANPTITKVLDVLSGGPYHWNVAHDELGNIFVSEYGYKSSENNARRIYRSQNDGETWSVVFEPDSHSQYHLHKIIVDPVTNYIYQSQGDRPNMGIYKSTDHGDTWVKIPATDGVYQPTGAVVLSGKILWGKDATPPGVLIHNLVDDSFEMASFTQPWGWEGVVYGMSEADGVVYATINSYDGVSYPRIMIVSRDGGDHWEEVYQWGPSSGDITFDDTFGYTFGRYPSATNLNSPFRGIRFDKLKTV